MFGRAIAGAVFLLLTAQASLGRRRGNPKKHGRRRETAVHAFAKIARKLRTADAMSWRSISVAVFW